MTVDGSAFAVSLNEDTGAVADVARAGVGGTDDVMPGFADLLASVVVHAVWTKAAPVSTSKRTIVFMFAGGKVADHGPTSSVILILLPLGPTLSRI